MENSTLYMPSCETWIVFFIARAPRKWQAKWCAHGLEVDVHTLLSNPPFPPKLRVGPVARPVSLSLLRLLKKLWSHKDWQLMDNLQPLICPVRYIVALMGVGVIVIGISFQI